MSKSRFSFCSVAVLATHLTAASILILAIGGTAQAVDIEWVTVGDPGNACDVQPQGCFGSVAYVYRIGKYEVTNAQYAEFLNAVAATDTYGLYSTTMAYAGGITRSGSSGSHTYSTIAGRENMPVNYVSFWDSLRFANWLHNGQPTGVQGNATTEDGAYTLDGYTGDDGSWIDRNAGATVFLTSEDEWYKAAYYDAVSMSYNPYPFADGFNGVVCEGPAGTTTHSANCNQVINFTTDVGSYTASPSPYGTFDQGGNIFEWNESIIIWPPFGTLRGLRGGNFHAPGSVLAATFWGGRPAGQSWEAGEIGFRVASTFAVQIDIKPGSCPNSWNRNSNGVLAVAILGTEDFDVKQIDVSNVTISRADGTGGSVAPNEGPPGPHSVFEDVGTPFEGEECGCHEAEADGFLDLSMKFSTQDVAELLPVDELDGALVPLVVSGTLLDGTEFTSSSDCVRLVPPGSPPDQVTVQSLAGAWTAATPLDNQLDGGGFGSFQRTYPHTTMLTLTGPSSHNGYPFVGWKLDEGDLIQGREITFVVNNAEHTAKAVFKKVNGCGVGFELVLLLPPLLWLHDRRRGRML